MARETLSPKEANRLKRANAKLLTRNSELATRVTELERLLKVEAARARADIDRAAELLACRHLDYPESERQLTLEEVSERTGLTKQRVQQIEAEGLKRLRKHCHQREREEWRK